MCVRLIVETTRRYPIDATRLAKSSGLTVSPEGRGVYLLTPSGECGCGFVRNHTEIKCDKWVLLNDAQIALAKAVQYLAEVSPTYRFTSHYFGEPIGTELAIKHKGFLEVLRGNSLENGTSYLVRGGATA